jgi:SAM-dependent methyltransferase
VLSTMRRHYLDERLSRSYFAGDVIDVGGKKTLKRGQFRPPLDRVNSWHYVNIDPATNPDYCCDAAAIPVADGSFDIAIVCEVLEHLRDPEKVIQEIARILRPGGRLYLSAPFLYPIHADPDDYQRWTPAKLRIALVEHGFFIDEIAPMGGVFAVICDVVLCVQLQMKHGFVKRLMGYVLAILNPIMAFFDRRTASTGCIATTGYFVTARKS